MKEIKIHSGPELIPAADIYQYTLKQLILGTFDTHQKEAIHTLLTEIEWIETTLKSIKQDDQLKIYKTILSDIKTSTNPHPLAWSAAYYYFSKLGINTTEMRLTINTSNALKNELKESILWKLIWN